MRPSRLAASACACLGVAAACDQLIGLSGPATSPGDSGPSDTPGHVACPVSTADSSAGGASVLEHHLHGTRDGAYVDHCLTKVAAANIVLDPAFDGKVVGSIYGQPLYVDGWKNGKDAVFVATDHNHVTALDAASGAVLWDNPLGKPIPLASLPCGGPYDPYGIMGTPVIDLTTRTLYAESFQLVAGGSLKKHFLYALSIETGDVQLGWPVDVAAKVPGFNPTLHNDRGGLTIVQGVVYVPYAGLNGDCGLDAGPGLPQLPYNGWVVGVKTSDPTTVGAYSTAAPKGGIWASVSSDGTHVYAVTGNTSTASWGGGEAVLRLSSMARFSGDASDYFTPSNWLYLDGKDADLGSSPAVLFDLPGATPSHLAVAMGKFGVVHLLDRDNLGGIGTGDGASGEGLFSLAVGGGMKGIAATYTSRKRRYVVVRIDTPMTTNVCPSGTTGDLLALHVTPTSPPTLVPAWCAMSQGLGAPIATTTDGESEAIVWIVSASGTNLLLAFDGDTGAAIYTGGGTAEQLGPVAHWTSPIVAKGRLFVGGEADPTSGLARVYAFKTK